MLVELDYSYDSPEYVLYQQLLNTSKSRLTTVGYSQFSMSFRQVIVGLRDSDVSNLVDNKATDLQFELDKIMKGNKGWY